MSEDKKYQSPLEEYFCKGTLEKIEIMLPDPAKPKSTGIAWLHIRSMNFANMVSTPTVLSKDVYEIWMDVKKGSLVEVTCIKQGNYMNVSSHPLVSVKIEGKGKLPVIYREKRDYTETTKPNANLTTNSGAESDDTPV
jgi:hypothetical protein